jgi:hypothetical protein
MSSGLRLIIWYAICLHCLWAVLLLSDRATTGATPVHVYHAVPRWLLVAILLTASVLAAYGVTRRRPTRPALVALLPQQALLVISAAGAVTAVIVAQYGDGVIRARSFILADQAPVILAVLLHTAAVLAILVRANRMAMMDSALGEVRGAVERPGGVPQDQHAMNQHAMSEDPVSSADASDRDRAAPEVDAGVQGHIED